MPTTRRTLLAAFLAIPALPLSSPSSVLAETSLLPLTLSCADSNDLTLAQSAGPYYKPNSPLRHDLYPDAPGGERITIAGFVRDVKCQPITDSIVEIWHADEDGDYDAVGFNLRGHQLTDKDGRWWFSTIVPAIYPGRTRHYHFRVLRPGGTILTTQLYFPNEPGNDDDYMYSDALLLGISDTADGKFGRFDFVV